MFIDPFSEGFLLDSVPFICQKETKAALGQWFSCRNSNDFEMRGRDRGMAGGASTGHREQRQLIQGMLRDGAVHEAPARPQGREMAARTKYTFYFSCWE